MLDFLFKFGLLTIFATATIIAIAYEYDRETREQREEEWREKSRAMYETAKRRAQEEYENEINKSLYRDYGFTIRKGDENGK